ncbi:gephyrin-like molybdotransferase Glp [Bacillus sp. P14.5]|uniref:molybdopterin molybdotransferase MoeA n=1 Tax=Bacillus sp. P14.5 TaxID=1983400 RepID=UPI000DE89660|nr:gephyrin-like molybdotransferase Glp [Bacillus sp. P14.5]
MLTKRTPIKVTEAVEKVMELAFAGDSEIVDITKAHGRYLGGDLVADHDVPSFNRSPYDGFAIRAEDTENASRELPAKLEVVGEIGAGSVFSGRVESGQAVRIMTGAQIPEGCSAVVMLELTKSSIENDVSYVEINRKYQVGDNISFKGEETRKGAILVQKGTFINPGVTALLATFGYRDVTVIRKPRVGVIATGSELLEVNEALEPGKIRNSNTYMILSQIERAGGVGIYFGQFQDDLEECFRQVTTAMEEVDIFITTGGVSVGDYDYLPEIYEKMGANVLFNKIGMRPGSVTTVAEKDGKLLFGLSGNPSACYVGFELLTRPVIQTYLHVKEPHLKKVEGILGADFKKPNPFTRFVRASVFFEDGRLTAIPSGLDKSSVVSSLASANAFIELPGGTRGFEKGMEIEIVLLEER